MGKVTVNVQQKHFCKEMLPAAGAQGPLFSSRWLSRQGSVIFHLKTLTTKQSGPNEPSGVNKYKPGMWFSQSQLKYPVYDAVIPFKD